MVLRTTTFLLGSGIARQSDVKDHHPALRWLVPDHLRVAIPRGDLRDDGVARELGEGATVGAVRQALYRRVAGRRVEEHQRRLAVLAEAAGILPIDHSRAAEHRAQIV